MKLKVDFRISGQFEVELPDVPGEAEFNLIQRVDEALTIVPHEALIKGLDFSDKAVLFFQKQ